jgi:hypothetical protein
MGGGAVVTAGRGKRLSQTVERRIDPLLVDLLSLGELALGQQLELIVDRGVVDAEGVGYRLSGRAVRVSGP